MAGASGKEQSPAPSHAHAHQRPPVTSRTITHSTLHPLSSSTPLDPALSTIYHSHPIALPDRLRSRSPRRRQSRSFHRHIFLSLIADSYKPTPTAPHHQNNPAKWPTSLPLLQRIPTNISLIPTNPRSLRNPSTILLPPPWTKRRQSLKRCCPPSLAAS